MRDGDLRQTARDRRSGAIFIIACAAVFLVIAACAAYIVTMVLT
jgi:predicted lysophospholipase L1 biosynthesis ABC-type transport system permease subunit